MWNCSFGHSLSPTSWFISNPFVLMNFDKGTISYYSSLHTNTGLHYLEPNWRNITIALCLISGFGKFSMDLILFWIFNNNDNKVTGEAPFPSVDLYLISEKSIWKNPLWRTGFLVYSELDFYCLCSLQKSISKLIFAG